MAALKKQINLLPHDSWEEKPIGRLVKWVLTIGRYIVILTELIVIIAFISRFKLDRDLSNLYEEIEIKQAKIRSLERFEEEFLFTQKQLKVIKDLGVRKVHYPQTLSLLASLVPIDVTLNKLELNQKGLALIGYSLSEPGLATFIDNLSQAPNFRDIRLNNVSRGGELKIDFKLDAQIIQNQDGQ